MNDLFNALLHSPVFLKIHVLILQQKFKHLFTAADKRCETKLFFKLPVNVYFIYPSTIKPIASCEKRFTCHVVRYEKNRFSEFTFFNN